MSQIKSDVHEIQQIDIEIKNLRARIRSLTSRKQDCEKRVLEYLRVNDQPGLRCDGMTVIVKNKEKRARKRQADRVSNGEQILRRHGVENSGAMLAEILDAMRGDAHEEEHVCFV